MEVLYQRIRQEGKILPGNLMSPGPPKFSPQKPVAFR